MHALLRRRSLGLPEGSAIAALARNHKRKERWRTTLTVKQNFPLNDPQKFTIVHKVFEAGNVNKMLQELPVHQRANVVSSLVYEANARPRWPKQRLHAALVPTPAAACCNGIKNVENFTRTRADHVEACKESLRTREINLHPPPQKADATIALTSATNFLLWFCHPAFECYGDDMEPRTSLL
ncbi:hypothetical protein K1719_006324 [Acacia pycnantha]|nr:hypothetical protein K1719_006324 [Acacia pycnantha]